MNSLSNLVDNGYMWVSIIIIDLEMLYVLPNSPLTTNLGS